MANGDIASAGMEQCGPGARIYIAEGDVKPVVIVLADLLGASDTITAADIIEGSATLSTPAIDGSNVTTNVTGKSGADYADIQITLSTGEKLTQRIVVVENTPNWNANDYEG